MKEDLLQFIWENQLFNHQKLQITQGENLEIINPGFLNPNQGPDFGDARIKIGSTLWAGNIEIHIAASDWFAHQHHLSKKYSNVILHVVFHNDLSEAEQKRLNIPVFELGDLIDENILVKYEELQKSKSWIPCAQNIQRIPALAQTFWLERMVVERLEQRYHEIIRLVRENDNNWQEGFYQYLARSFGFKVNNSAFFHLARNTPIHIAGKHKDNLFQLEALLFGQAGFLHPYLVDEYPKKLLKEYRFLKEKYKLEGVIQNEWNFSRLRPGNFPTVRIAQFAALLFKSNRLFSKLQEVDNLKQLFVYFEVSASGYWNNHYTFDKATQKNVEKKLGKSSVLTLITNTVIPFLFAYGKENLKPDIEKRSIRFLYELPHESNRILDQWQQLGIENNSAARSQSLLYLHKNYCLKKQCLRCHLGTAILKLD